MKIKLAEALLRRKELQQKVDRLQEIKKEGLFEFVAERKNITESLDDTTEVEVPDVVMEEYVDPYVTESK